MQFFKPNSLHFRIYPVLFILMYLFFSLVTRLVFMNDSKNVFELTNRCVSDENLLISPEKRVLLFNILFFFLFFRRGFFVWLHYMYFYNVFLGLLSALTRIIISIIVGITFIGRVDYPILPQSMQHRDAGEKASKKARVMTSQFEKEP